MTSSVTS